MTNKKLFLSAVSSEFLAYRQLLSGDLKRPTLDVAVQEDFVVTGGSTLEKLDDYIRACDGVVHLIGLAQGSVPEEPAVAALLRRYPDFAERLPPLAAHLAKPQPGFSYTQWEAYLALYHHRKLRSHEPAARERRQGRGSLLGARRSLAKAGAWMDQAREAHRFRQALVVSLARPVACAFGRASDAGYRGPVHIERTEHSAAELAGGAVTRAAACDLHPTGKVGATLLTDLLTR